MLKNPITAIGGFRCLAITWFGVMATLLGLVASDPGAQGQSAGPDAAAAVTSEPPVVWGCVDGTQAYSTGGGVCNLGDAPLPGNNLGGYNHPMWTQNLYRLKDNRFEQIGMSWVKHDDWSSDLGPCYACGSGEGDCGPYQNPPHDTPGALDPGCRDTYAACLNGCQGPPYGSLGPRSQINPATGVWPTGGPGSQTYCNPASGGGVIACRLQVKVGDLAPVSPSAQYFLEQQVITPDEPSAARNNNVSYKSATVGPCNASLCTGLICDQPPECPAVRTCTGAACSCPGGGAGVYPLAVSGTHFCREPAIRAWQGIDPGVVETDIQVPNEGLFILAAKASSIDCGWWRYEYALYNMNSDRSAGAFRVPLPTDAQFQIRNIGFHDINYHSGEIWNGADWLPANVAPGSITWATTAYAQNQNANALRWGTLYNFRFEAKRGPDCASTDVTIELFRPGTPSSVLAASVVPGASPAGACYVGTTCTEGPQTCCTRMEPSSARGAPARTATGTACPTYAKGSCRCRGPAACRRSNVLRV